MTSGGAKSFSLESNLREPRNCFETWHLELEFHGYTEFRLVDSSECCSRGEMLVTATQYLLLAVAALPFVYYLLAIYSATRFFSATNWKHRQNTGYLPPISCLKPIKGLDPAAYFPSFGGKADVLGCFFCSASSLCFACRSSSRRAVSSETGMRW